MAESELEERCESPGIVFQRDMMNSEDDGGGERENDNTIHSGQFMLSVVHGGGAKNTETTVDVALEEQQKTMLKQLIGDWKFSSRKQTELPIDTSLRKLFECMTLAYRFVEVLDIYNLLTVCL